MYIWVYQKQLKSENLSIKNHYNEFLKNYLRLVLKRAGLAPSFMIPSQQTTNSILFVISIPTVLFSVTPFSNKNLPTQSLNSSTLENSCYGDWTLLKNYDNHTNINIITCSLFHNSMVPDFLIQAHSCKVHLHGYYLPRCKYKIIFPSLKRLNHHILPRNSSRS